MGCQSVCLVCHGVVRADQIEADGVCEGCHMHFPNDPEVGTEADLFDLTVAMWARDVAQLRARGQDVTASMRVAGGAR